MWVIFKELSQQFPTSCFSPSPPYLKHQRWWPASLCSPGSYPGIIRKRVRIIAFSPKEADNGMGLLAIVFSRHGVLCLHATCNFSVVGWLGLMFLGLCVSWGG